MSRILRAAASAALSFSLFVPTAASADHWGSADDAGDVHGVHYSPEPEPCGTSTEVDGTSESNEDITGLSLRHTRTAVQVTTTFRDLDDDLEQMESIYLRTPVGGYWLDIDRYEARSGHWRTETFLSKAPTYPDPDEVGECGFGVVSIGLACRVGRTIDFDEDLIRLTVPRTCLKSPGWVRVGADSYQVIEPDDPDADPTFTVFYDDWDRGTVLTKWRISYGPRVHATEGAQVGPSRDLVRTTAVRRHFSISRDGIFARR
jgi:hypothetical protein